MSDFRPYPRLEAFERLHISDGLTINAERWQQAHGYHRQRQNFHYQAVYEPGIVYGLGVAPVPDQPDGRLLQIQPGVAIDIEGNPIIVGQPEEFRIASEPVQGEPLVIYLAVSYVDPSELRRIPSTKTVQETFRIVEKLHLAPGDVELCRIRLQPGAVSIQAPTDVFHPIANQLDLHGRSYPSPYPQFQVQVGQIIHDRVIDGVTLNGLEDLLRSLKGLYPSLGGSPAVQTFSSVTLGQTVTIQCQLLHISYRLLQTLTDVALQRLQSYLTEGGVLLVVADFDEVDLLDLLNIGQELRSGLEEAERDPDLLRQTGAQLQAEIAANRSAVAERLAAINSPLASVTAQLGLSLSESGDLSDDHPLRGQPFVFSQLPQRLGHSIVVKNWGGLVLMVGDLTHCWGRAATPEIPRETVRSAQEWGVNLLQFAAQRWQWTQALKPRSAIPDAPVDSLQRRVQSPTS